jgi:serine/threonine-protein kinase
MLLRFENEARILGLHPHPGVLSASAFDVAEDGRPFIVMDLLSGEDLNACLRRRRRLPLALCYRLLKQAADALYHLHQLGIVHRDLKPANLFLCASRPSESPEDSASLKILDFGTAKILGEESAGTIIGDIHGTPCFQAPELLGEAGGTVDALADQFSLAATAYLMMSGSSPFASDTLLGTVDRVRKYHPPPLSALCPDIPESVDKVIQRSLSKRREQRYPTLACFIRALKEAIEGSCAIPLSRPASEPCVQAPAQPVAGAESAAPRSAAPLPEPYSNAPEGNPCADLDRTQQIEPSLLETLRTRSERSGKQVKPARTPPQEPQIRVPAQPPRVQAALEPRPIASPLRDRSAVLIPAGGVLGVVMGGSLLFL